VSVLTHLVVLETRLFLVVCGIARPCYIIFRGQLWVICCIDYLHIRYDLSDILESIKQGFPVCRIYVRIIRDSISLLCYVKVGLKLPIVPEHIHVIKHKGCGDSTTSTPYILLVFQIILLMTHVILVQISDLIGLKKKVKCTLVQALRLCTGRTAQHALYNGSRSCRAE
jgi:hypothetical protein